MKGRSKSKKLLVLNSRDIHVGWIVGSAIFMLVCLLATFAIAYRHDAYSAKLGLGDLMTTDVWFRVFLALTCFSLLLFLGLLVYAFIAGRISKSGDNKGQTSRMTAETPVTREMAPAFGKKAPVTKQPERVIINEPNCWMSLIRLSCTNGSATAKTISTMSSKTCSSSGTIM